MKRQPALKGVGPAADGVRFALLALVLSGLALASKAQAGEPQPTMTKEPAAPSQNQTRTSLHQELRFKASAQRIYEALLSSQQFAAFSGAPATIDPRVGGAFSMFNGMIAGISVELVPNQRLVQAWRPSHWEPGVFSIVRFELRPQGQETLVVLDHTGFPAGSYDSLSSGWNAHYWQPLAKFLAAPAAPK